MALFWTKAKFAKAIERRQGSDWSPDPALAKFPSLDPRKAPSDAPKALAVEDLINAWANESGTTGKALYDRVRTGKLLTNHVGHTDATRITADDVVAWKEARLKAGRSTKTVANDIGELRPIWTWAKRNRKLTFAENPFSGLAPKTKKRGRGPRGSCDTMGCQHACLIGALAPWSLCSLPRLAVHQLMTLMDVSGQSTLVP